MTVHVTRQDYLDLKTQMEIDNRRDKAEIESFRQKLNEPAPLVNSPALQAEINKAYGAYQKIISDIIKVYLSIDEICQVRIGLIDHVIHHLDSAPTNLDLSQEFASFRSLLEPLKSHSVQLRRNLQVEKTSLAVIMAKAEEIWTMETKESPLIYPPGLRRRSAYIQQ